MVLAAQCIHHDLDEPVELLVQVASGLATGVVPSGCTTGVGWEDGGHRTRLTRRLVLPHATRVQPQCHHLLSGGWADLVRHARKELQEVNEAQRR